MKSTPILATGLLVAAHANAPFVRKAGEWQIAVFQKNERTDPPEKSCYGNATVADITKGMGDCAKRDIRTHGGTTTMDAICTRANRHGTFHIAIAAMGDSFYHSEMHVIYSPPISGTSDVDHCDGCQVARTVPGGRTAHQLKHFGRQHGDSTITEPSQGK